MSMRAFVATDLQPGQSVTLDTHHATVRGETIHGPITVTRDAKYRNITVAYVTIKGDDVSTARGTSMMIGHDEAGNLDGFSQIGRDLHHAITYARAV